MYTIFQSPRQLEFRWICGPQSRNFYVRTQVNVTRLNKIEAMYELKVAHNVNTSLNTYYYARLFIVAVYLRT